MTLIAARAAPAAAAASRSSVRAASLPRVGATWVAIGIIALAGFCLRLAAARGDLWLDELWSLDLVSHVASPDQVFWNIPHDNNHPLNSLWMFLVGQRAPALVYRLPAVLFGTATILVAARIGARVNAAAAVAAAALAAVSYPFVDYGSEARGYAGLILAILLAVDLQAAAVDGLLVARPDADAVQRRRAWLLAAVVLFGTASHLTMLVEAAILGLASALRLKVAGRTWRTALDETTGLFRPTLALLLPLLGALGAGIVLHGGFTIGGVVPFTVERTLRGYGGLVQMLLGLPVEFPHALALGLAAGLIGTAFATGLIHRRWLSLAVVALVVWPAAVLLMRVPNTEYARYFLTAGLVVPIFCAETTGRLWDHGLRGRVLAIAIVGAISAGQLPYVRELLVAHRGAPAPAVALMANDGPATFASRNSAITDPVVEVYALRRGADLKPALRSDRCRAPARWIVYDADYDEVPPPAYELAGPGCNWRYSPAAAFPSALWSGRSWTIYRRVP